jgi:hypothetical protein
MPRYEVRLDFIRFPMDLTYMSHLQNLGVLGQQYEHDYVNGIRASSGSVEVGRPAINTPTFIHFYVTFAMKIRKCIRLCVRWEKHYEWWDLQAKSISEISLPLSCSHCQVHRSLFSSCIQSSIPMFVS